MVPIEIHNLAHREIERLAVLQHVTFEEMLLTVIELGIRQMKSSSRLKESKFASLSKTQHKVLNLLKQAKSVKEVATDLSISETTVRTHITRLKEKLDCQDLLELRML